MGMNHWSLYVLLMSQLISPLAVGQQTCITGCVLQPYTNVPSGISIIKTLTQEASGTCQGTWPICISSDCVVIGEITIKNLADEPPGPPIYVHTGGGNWKTIPDGGEHTFEVSSTGGILSCHDRFSSMSWDVYTSKDVSQQPVAQCTWTCSKCPP